MVNKSYLDQAQRFAVLEDLAKRRARAVEAIPAAKTVRATRQVIRSWYQSRWWRSARRNILKEQPFCMLCARRGVERPSTTVDHIEPHRGRPGWFFNHFNLQGLCAPCHNSIKKKWENDKGSGAMLDGSPIKVSEGW